MKAALLEAAVAMPAVLEVVSAAATLEVTPALEEEQELALAAVMAVASEAATAAELAAVVLAVELVVVLAVATAGSYPPHILSCQITFLE